MTKPVHWIEHLPTRLLSGEHNHQRATEELGLEKYVRQRLWRLSDDELRVRMGWPLYLGSIRRPAVEPSPVAHIQDP